MQSTTFVLVYLMRAEGMSFQQALGYVRSKRAIICPNYGFQNQLKRYELALKKNNAPKQDKEKDKEPNYDQFAEKKAVFDFLSDEKKRPLKAEEKFNATQGAQRSYLGQKVVGNKTTDYNAFLRGKSMNYQQKQRGMGMSVDYRSKVTNMAKGFLSYKMQNPKIVTIKK